MDNNQPLNHLSVPLPAISPGEAIAREIPPTTAKAAAVAPPLLASPSVAMGKAPGRLAQRSLPRLAAPPAPMGKDPFLVNRQPGAASGSSLLKTSGKRVIEGMGVPSKKAKGDLNEEEFSLGIPATNPSQTLSFQNEERKSEFQLEDMFQALNLEQKNIIETGFDSSTGLTTTVLSNGIVETFMLQEGMRQGPGTIKRPDDSILKVIYKNGVLNGPASMSKSNGDIIEFMYQDGVAQGPATWKKLNGTIQTFVLQNGKGHGQAQIKWPDGAILDLVLQEGKRHGPATKKLLNGTTVAYYFQNDRVTGRVTTTLPDGSQETSDFRNGKPHGPGQKTFPSGIILEFYYDTGILSGEAKLSKSEVASIQFTFQNKQASCTGILQLGNEQRRIQCPTKERDPLLFYMTILDCLNK